MLQRRWALVVAAAITVALVSLASNITSESQLSAEANTLLAVRFTFSKVVNSGTVWAGLPILSGWLVRRPIQAFVAGIVAALMALAVHYGVGQLFGMFDETVWAANSVWFALAVVAGGPLGLIGALARSSRPWGSIARLVVPAGAMIEPFFRRMFRMPMFLPWPDRVSSFVAGVVLVVAGLIATAVLIRRHRRKPATHCPRASEPCSSTAPPARRYRRPLLRSRRARDR
ncbi:MAG: DUF6518 family protein [Rhodococcus sp. (in: high G+C Gram-positive bacteria)]|uniref:DUF6518 family protein n=1 Tax=Rhodococcus sp. TaxID=1831 RepID=UPI002ADCBAF4|nr:DUF6518 family protein [Rhodococcus sp. (in: high G+C Gram-positive bacteria)]